jgi:hypothetical protein
MRDIAREIRNTVDEALVPFNSMGFDEVSQKETSDSWSKKEILGHLIDSAVNNHQRFVRACTNDAADFPAYNQMDWVRVQQYNKSEWGGLVELWAAFNYHLSDLIERIPEEFLSASVNIGKEEPVSLEFVIRDYLRHLRHHMTDLLASEK